jgi:chromosome segregation ATPase
MNNLGKTLAVVNLVMSVLVAAFIVNAYVARTNWHEAFKKQEAEFGKLLADRNTYAEEVNKLHGDVNTANAAKQQAADALAKADDTCKGRMTELENKLTQEVKKVREREASLASQTLELDHRQKEVDYLKQLIVSRDDQLKDMVAKVEASRARAVDMELAAKSEQRRNEALLTENERLTNLSKSAQRGETVAGGERAAPRHNPPAEDVQGQIKALDPQSGLVTISIGSDAGLNKGNTLEVFRLKPEAAYLGQIEILAVRSNEAVGKPTVRTRGTIQVGDRVASNILNRR